MEQGWTFAGIWEAVADAHPDYLAQIYGPRRFTWQQFDGRADGVARALLDSGLGRQAKVAQYLYNCPEYLESMFGCLKAGLVPVNTNYRYGDDELVYLWDDAEIEAVIFDRSFTAVCERLRSRLPRIRAWIRVDPGPAGVGTEPLPRWAVDYEVAAASAPGRTEAPWGRSGGDLVLMYTGGTTGMPKGVMWAQDQLFRYMESLGKRRHPEVADPAGYAATLHKPGPRVLPAPPLMHGAGAWFAMAQLCRAGSVVTLPDRSYRPEALLDALAAERVNGVALVGDPFARPLADALDAESGRWDLSSLNVIVSSGAMFSAATKRRLLAHIPGALIVDALGSSETGAIAQSTAEAGSDSETGKFSLKPGSRVIGDDGREVEPVPGAVGRLAVSGYLPQGYYRDSDKTAASFVTIEGRVHAFTGDWVEYDAEGGVRLLGRGSACINTGGEKVFPEEVEEVVKRHPAVADAVVVGVPDERFGESIAAVVELRPHCSVNDGELFDHVRRSLAGYKVPRHILRVPTIGRADNGKADLPGLKRLAAERLGIQPLAPTSV